MSLGGHIARIGEKWNACRLLVRNSKGKRPLRRSRSRWADNITTSLRNDGVDWIRLDQDRDSWMVLANTALNLRVP
jgi:hypothetical protein